MKILYTLPDLHFGGTSNLLVQTLPDLAKKHEVYLIYFGVDDTMRKKFEASGIYPARINYYGLKNAVKAASVLRKFIKKEKIELVHANLILDKFIVGLAIQGMKTRSVATIHSADTLLAEKSLKHKLWFKLENLLHNKVFDKTIVVSAAAKNIALSKRRIKKKKINILHNGIQGLEKHIPNNKIFNAEEDIIFGTACRFQEIKGLHRLLDVFAKLHIDLPNLKLILIGDGPLRDGLEREIIEYQLENSVHITGFTDDVALYLNQLHYYVNSSFSEGLPISVLEALSLGKPVIASNVGGLPEVIEKNYNGLLVNFEDIEGTVSRIRTFLFEFHENYLDFETNARQSFEDSFSSEIFLKKLLDIYNGDARS
jgi:glycosyltransferase involved in cell wall biosynthesis